MDNDRPQSSIPKRRVLKRGESGETSDNDLNPLMKKTVLYSQKKPDDSKDDYYDDEIVETTWVVKLGNKKVSDKEMLDFVSSQLKNKDLFADLMKPDNGSSSATQYMKTFGRNSVHVNSMPQRTDRPPIISLTECS
uniref:Uncharacterized protein n=1 Tax=Trichobilharzia regenti TaxID=157069 RepID=A0AA85KGC0_TRIRE|nr:unnamed protein product [Trichobilharzia regenti]